jgi:DNA mismatch repair protein MSH3
MPFLDAPSVLDVCLTPPLLRSYVRMVALLCLMGQIGSFLPCDSARLCVLDGIYTRMGAGDDLAAGMSTFLLELHNTSFILHKATARSLVILVRAPTAAIAHRESGCILHRRIHPKPCTLHRRL